MKTAKIHSILKILKNVKKSRLDSICWLTETVLLNETQNIDFMSIIEEAEEDYYCRSTPLVKRKVAEKPLQFGRIRTVIRVSQSRRSIIMHCRTERKYLTLSTTLFSILQVLSQNHVVLADFADIYMTGSCK